MKPQAHKTYRVTSPLREFTMAVDQTDETAVTGNCYPGGYRGTIPLTSIRGPEDPPGATFTFRELIGNVVGGMACAVYFGAAMYCIAGLVA